MIKAYYDGSSSMWVARKPGWQPPAWLIRKMAAVHPRVALVWSPGSRCWGLMERCIDGVARLIAPIQGRPTYQNTVGFLNQCISPRMRDVDDQERFVGGLEGQEERIESDLGALAEGRMEEGSDRLWQAIGTDHQVSLHGTRTRKS